MMFRELASLKAQLLEAKSAYAEALTGDTERKGTEMM
jgi:hypothetical protein